MVPWVAAIEQDFNAVERLKHYCELEQEAPALQPADPPIEQWPTQGAISFRDIRLRYRPGLPLVLKGLSFEVKPGEKVGIIGRTGAGKSSLVQAIYRTVELSGGQISVDGVNLRNLGLQTVSILSGVICSADGQIRSRMAIIPQEPFLFGGTVRYVEVSLRLTNSQNIDPGGLQNDATLNTALALIHANLAASISIREKYRLDAEVSTDGSNFSAGEKQLCESFTARR